MKSKLVISCRMMHNLIKRATNRWMGGLIQYYMYTCVRAILFKLLTHDIQAPMRVNVTSERIPGN